jgi:predicted nucleotidyltransferase
MGPDKPVSSLIDSVTDWAANQSNISGVALVGSQARGEARSDSDIDVVLLCTGPNELLSDTSWIQNFGEVKTCHTEDWGLVTSLRVHYRGGVEVEFGITTPGWAGLPVDPGTQSVVSHGMRILLDRDGALRRLLEAVSAL